MIRRQNHCEDECKGEDGRKEWLQELLVNTDLKYQNEVYRDHDFLLLPTKFHFCLEKHYSFASEICQHTQCDVKAKYYN